MEYIKGLEHGVLFDVLHTFINLKNGNKVNKDYTRNIQYRVKMDLKRGFNLDHADIFDIIGTDRLFCVKDGKDIKTPKTQIKENLVHFIPNDALLDNFINLLYPLENI